MHTQDFAAAMAAALTASGFLYLHWYPLALFCALFFLLVLVNVTIFHNTMPQPRWIIGIGVPKLKEEETEETE